MKVKQRAGWSILLGLAILLGIGSPAQACDPLDDEATNGGAIVCRSTTSTARVIPPPAVAPASAPAAPEASAPPASAERAPGLVCLLPFGDSLANALGYTQGCAAPPPPQRIAKAPAPAPTPAKTVVSNAPAPKGDSPLSALPIDDKWQTLGPRQVHWYKIDNGKNFYLDLWLDAHHKGNITLSVFSPEQINELSVNAKPKGRGTPAKNEPTHDLYWSGSYATGVWHALVVNYNDVPVEYKLGTKQSTTDRKCVSYWEWLPTGEYVLWTDCGHYTDVNK